MRRPQNEQPNIAMTSEHMRWLAQKLYNNRDYRFWLCQVTGWAGYSLVTFLNITLIDDNVSWPHIGHISLSAFLGILTSWTLRPLYRHTFDLSLALRLVIATTALVLASAVWTALRIILFAWIVGEQAIWKEFHYWFFGSLFVFLSWTVLYYGIRYYELLTLEHQKLLEESARKREEQLRRLRAESSARDAQLQMLRYQLNPHFLFNTLNTINALVKLGENDKAREMLQLLSDFLRHSLEQGDTHTVTLAQELESLMLYLDIEKARFGDRLTLEFDIEPQARKALVPSLILQPVIENSMKHAIANSPDGGTVRLEACVLKDDICLKVSDTGPELPARPSEERRGVGLSNILHRLETLYKNRYSFDISEAGDPGFTVTIRFPFETAAPQDLGIAGMETSAA